MDMNDIKKTRIQNLNKEMKKLEFGNEKHINFLKILEMHGNEEIKGSEIKFVLRDNISANYKGNLFSKSENANKI